MDIMCSLKVDYNNYGVDFKTVFADAIEKLDSLRDDGLVNVLDNGFEVTPLGRLFLRNIAMLFDNKLAGKRYSKTL